MDCLVWLFGRNCFDRSSRSAAKFEDPITPERELIATSTNNNTRRNSMEQMNRPITSSTMMMPAPDHWANDDEEDEDEAFEPISEIKQSSTFVKLEPPAPIVQNQIPVPKIDPPPMGMKMNMPVQKSKQNNHSAAVLAAVKVEEPKDLDFAALLMDDTPPKQHQSQISAGSEKFSAEVLSDFEINSDASGWADGL